MPNFTFARGNATRLLSVPLYALGWAASHFVRRSDTLWVFACGSGIGEGALELYRYSQAANPSLRLVWLVRSHAELVEAGRLGLVAVPRSSWRGFRLTLRARVIVVTHGLGDANRFGTRGAFLVQLWHGIPLKKIQLDSPATFRGLAPRLMRALYRRNMSALDLVPAASETSAERLRSAFGIAAERVVVTGDPRDDVLFRDKDAARELLSNGIGDVGSDRVILFAPTWRDGETDPTIPNDEEWVQIAALLERTAHVLVVRPHPHSVGDYSAGPRHSPRIRMLTASVHNDITPNLPAIDILITDYSSTAFDFALLGRPIIFLAPDAADYARTRGFYEPYPQFTGESEVSTWAEVLVILESSDALARLSSHAKHLAQSHHRFHDGRNTERLYKELLTRVERQA